MNEVELAARVNALIDADNPGARAALELLIQAARVDPILRAAALDVDAAIFAKDQLIEEYAMVTGELAYRLNREGKLA